MRVASRRKELAVTIGVESREKRGKGEKSRVYLASRVYAARIWKTNLACNYVEVHTGNRPPLLFIVGPIDYLRLAAFVPLS